MSLEQLVELSRRYGNTPGYVLGGGGNTSYKNAAALWVKASGQSLASIAPEGFVALDRGKVRQVLAQTYPAAVQEREALVLANLMDSRLFQLGRPSVETFLHELLDFPYVVHTHPAAVNALTCSLGGRAAFDALFPDAVWVEYTDPGYLLAIETARLVEAYRGAHGRPPQVLFLENHGLVVAGSSPEEVDAIHKGLFDALPPASSVPKAGSVPHEQRTPIEALLSQTLSKPGASASFAWAPGTMGTELVSAFTPDHIVYMGVRPLFPASPADLPAEIASYRSRFGRDPRVAVVPDAGVVAFAPTPVAAQLALDLFLDAVAVARGSLAFGGPQFLSAPSIEFILNWEVERFRSKTSGAG